MSFKHNPRAGEILRRRRQRMQAKQNGTPVEQDTPGYQSVKSAVWRKDYNVLYALLRRQTETFTPKEAFALCCQAIQRKCTLHAFQTILAHCPPLPDFACFGNLPGESAVAFSGGGLVTEAAKEDHVPVLQYLLEQGCDPNQHEGDLCSPLEMALQSCSIGAIKLLVQRDDVDFTVTDHMRYIWADMGSYPRQDHCFCAAAGRLLGKDKVYSEVPLLPGMTVSHAADKENWPLVYRLCRETEVTAEQVRAVLSSYISGLWECGVCFCVDQELAHLFDALLTVCPEALQDETVRWLLAISVLCARVEELERLRPWAEKMPEGDILPMEIDGCLWITFETPEDAARSLRRWEERLGRRFRPVLQRDKFLPYEIIRGDDHDDVLRAFFEVCTVKGTPQESFLSPLAEDVLRVASPTLVVEFYAQKKLFWQEDAAALLDFCKTLPDGDRKRAALLGSGIRKTVEYAL